MKNRTSGFTLVELMVVVLLVGLVVLVSTQIPLFTFSSWRKGTDRLRMQRDAHLVMIKIQRKLRPASLSGDPRVSVNDYDEQEGYYRRLVIGGDSFYVDKEGTSETNDFFYDVVQESGGNKEVIVEGDLGTDFNVIPEGSAINMTLKLVRRSVETILRTAVKPRN